MAEENAKHQNAGEAETPDAEQDKTQNLAQPTKSDDPAETDRPHQVANPNAGEAGTPSISRDLAPDTSEPEATAIPSAGKPDTEPTGPERDPKPGSTGEVNEAPAAKDDKPAAKAKGEKPAKPPREKPAAKDDGDDKAAKPAAKKKEKPPAVEDKPFPEFITQEYLPKLQKTLANQGIEDCKVTFEKQSLPIRGVDDTECWQVIGKWQSGDRMFIIGFMKEDINGPKFFTHAANGAKPSILESFMIDERRITLDLLLLYTIQRLNGQKWLNTAKSLN